MKLWRSAGSRRPWAIRSGAHRPQSHDGRMTARSEVDDVSRLSNPRRRSIAHANTVQRLRMQSTTISRRTDWPAERPDGSRRHSTTIRFFNLANALRSEIATRRRRLRDIVITAVGVTTSSIIQSPHWSSLQLRSHCRLGAAEKFLYAYV